MLAINYQVCHNFLAPISYLVCDLGLGCQLATGWARHQVLPQGPGSQIYRTHEFGPK